MFDFAFSEIALIGVVALVVIGPERLPRVARTAGVVVGRLQRYAAAVKADIAREVELSELRRVQSEIKDAAQSFESGIRDSLASAESHFQSGQQALMSGPQPAALPPSDASVRPAAPPLDSPAISDTPHTQTSLFSPAEAPPGSGTEADAAMPGAAPPVAPPPVDLPLPSTGTVPYPSTGSVTHPATGTNPPAPNEPPAVHP